MKSIGFVMSEHGFTQDRCKNMFQNSGFTVYEKYPDIYQLMELPEDLDAYLIFATDSLHLNTAAAVYLKERIEDFSVPCFLMGDATVISTVLELLPANNIMGIYRKPYEIKSAVPEIINGISAFAENRRRKILVVDDSGPMLRTIKSWLEDRYNIITANSGAVALRQLSATKPDLVLLDYEMPVCDGRQVLEMIRTDPAVADIPVIFLTANDNTEDIQRVLALKPAGYILKTLPPSEIIAHVDSFFIRNNM